MTDKFINFHPNPDDSHCAVCCLRMGLEYFEPEKSWLLDALNALLGKTDDHYVWMSRIYVEMARLGYDLFIYDPFDYAVFAKTPELYLREYYGAAHAADLLAHTDLDDAVAAAQDLTMMTENNILSLSSVNGDAKMIKELLDQGYLLFCMVDEAVLAGMPDKVLSHAILVYGYDDAGMIAHNPGIKSLDSARPAQHIAPDLFDKARALGKDGAAGKFMAFRPQTKE